MGWTGDWSFHFMVSDDKFHFPLYLSSWPLWRRPVIIAKARSFALLVALLVGLSVGLLGSSGKYLCSCCYQFTTVGAMLCWAM